MNGLLWTVWKKSRYVLPLMMAFALAACGGDDDPAPATPDPVISPTITSVAINTTSLNLSAGESQAISASVTGTGAFNSAVTWTIESGDGALSNQTSSSATFTAAVSNTAGSAVVRATSVQDPTKIAEVTFNIAASAPTSSIVTVSIAASPVNIHPSESTALTATVTGTGAFDTAVTWAITAGGGSLSSNTGNSVNYQAPSSSSAAIAQVTATSVQDPTKSYTILLGIHPVQATLAAGNSFVLGIKPDGALLSWGDNDYGQLGNNNPLFDSNTPVAVIGATNIVAVAAGAVHSLALKADGTVLAWGNDAGGQLGDDAPLVDKATPVTVSGATDVVAIAAGYFFSLALKSDGTMLAWGNDSHGQLGDNIAIADKPTPVAVVGASNIVAIDAGSEHSLALKADGTLLAWGLDASGQLGDNLQNIDQPLPVSVVDASNIVAISAGGETSLALNSSGNVLAWGSDFAGQLGDNTPSVNKSTPVSVATSSQITAISAGNLISLALTSNGTVLAWGSDTYGELGNGSQISPAGLPVNVENASDIVAIAAGSQFSTALKSDGTVQSWGRNNSGQLGNSTVMGAGATSPVSVLLGTATIRVP